MDDPNREIVGKVVLVTGGGSGIGAALVRAFCAAGAAEVIAAGRHAIASGPGVRPMRLDVTDAMAVAVAAEEFAARVDILVNNAGVNGNSGVLEPDPPPAAREEMEVNYFGVLNMLRAFSPAMRSRGRGVIVNMLTIASYANLPAMGSYCASKAAAWSLTQASRAELAPVGVRVCAIFPSAVDTRMTTGLPGAKLLPEEVAAETLRAIREGVEDAYPGKLAQDLYAAFRQDAKALERRFAALLPGRRVGTLQG